MGHNIGGLGHTVERQEFWQTVFTCMAFSSQRLLLSRLNSIAYFGRFLKKFCLILWLSLSGMWAFLWIIIKLLPLILREQIGWSLWVQILHNHPSLWMLNGQLNIKKIDNHVRAVPSLSVNLLFWLINWLSIHFIYFSNQELF